MKRFFVVMALIMSLVILALSLVSCDAQEQVDGFTGGLFDKAVNFLNPFFKEADKFASGSDFVEPDLEVDTQPEA